MPFHYFIIFCLSLGLTALSVARAELEKPNIIFLLADDQNVASIGCYGNEEVVTPQMDRLGEDGIVFDRYYNTTSICMASRANIFTGMYEYKTGTNFEHGDMKPEVWAKSYPVLLREAGYLTAFAGKFGIEVEGKGLCQSDFDIWGGAPGQSRYNTAKNASMKKYSDEYPHSTLSYAAFGRDVIREAVKQKKPFCLSISFKAPHRPVTPDPQFDHIYQGKTFTKPANYGREAGAHLSPQSKKGRQYRRFEQWGYSNNYDAVMAKYYQQIYAIDVALGMLREEIDAQRVSDNTVIIYTSDNGFICGSHGYGSKVLPLEESSRAPLMILDPRMKTAGKQLRAKALSGNIDIAPTILNLAGLPIPTNIDGKSLIPVLNDAKAEGHDSLALFSTFLPIATTCMTLIQDEFKYTYWWYGDHKMEPTEELFHLSRDPLEMTNFKNDPEYKDHLNVMRQSYDKQFAALKKDVVSYNGYTKYVTLFDRHAPLSEKKFALKKRKPATKK